MHSLNIFRSCLDKSNYPLLDSLLLSRMHKISRARKVLVGSGLVIGAVLGKQYWEDIFVPVPGQRRPDPRYPVPQINDDEPRPYNPYRRQVIRGSIFDLGMKRAYSLDDGHHHRRHHHHPGRVNPAQPHTMFEAASITPSLSLSEPDQSAFELVQVQMFMRHGARTPCAYMPWETKESFEKEWQECRSGLVGGTPWDDRMDEDVIESQRSGCRPGQLTIAGEKMCVELGKRMKKRYIDELEFIPDEIDLESIGAETTKVRRMIMIIGYIYRERDVIIDIYKYIIVNILFNMFYYCTYYCIVLYLLYYIKYYIFIILLL